MFLISVWNRGLNIFVASKNFCRGDSRRVGPTPEGGPTESPFGLIYPSLPRADRNFMPEKEPDVHPNDKSNAILTLRVLKQAT